MNEEEAAASFSFLSVEEADGRDGGLIRRQRRMAEGSLDGNACKVFVWGLNDRHQLGSSQSENKVKNIRQYTEICGVSKPYPSLRINLYAVR